MKSSNWPFLTTLRKKRSARGLRPAPRRSRRSSILFAGRAFSKRVPALCVGLLLLAGLGVTYASGGAPQFSQQSSPQAAQPPTSLNGPGNVFLTATLIVNPQSGSATSPSVVVADFNGDGKSDFAVTSAGCNTCGVSVVLGNGDGTFQAAQPTANLGGPYYVAAGDFNGDGKQDLAVLGLLPTSLTTPALFILTGNGNGTFTLKSTTTGFSNPQSIVVGDFNGDTKLDLAVVDRGSNSVIVFLGNGDGTFQAPVNTSGLGTGFATYAAAADFNKDGKLDLVVSDQGSGHIVVLLGNGNGTFQTARSFAFPAGQVGNGFDVAVGDFNGDGIPDIASTNADPRPGVVNIFLGIGDGNFRAPASFAVGQTGVGSDNIAVGDFNKDGKLDLIISVNGNFNSGSSVSVLYGKGDGTFAAPLLLAANQAPAQIAIADFNGDGNLDWIAGSTTGRFTTLALGNGNGTFEAGVNYATGVNPEVALGDFNRDGKLDLVTVNANSGSVSVFLGNGDGTFQAAMNTAISGAFFGIAVGDLNGDGIPDVVVGDSTGFPPRNVIVLLGKGDGTFAAPVRFSTGGSGEGQIVIADLNGDGKSDIAVVNQADNTVSVLLGNGNGTFQAPKITGALASDGFLGSIVAADFNGDGKLDLAVPDYVGAGAGQVAILLGKGDGTFQSPTFLTSAGGSTGAAVGDFNKDGKMDLAVANQFGTINVFLGNGNGTFNTPLVLSDVHPFGGCCQGNPIPISIAVGDFNLDGNLDLLVGDANSDLSNAGLVATNQNVGLQLFLGNGDGTFTGPQDYLAGAQSNPVVVGDFNRDGAPDVAAGDPGENFVSILLNQTPPPIAVSPSSLSFGNQLVGTTSSALVVKVSNNGATATTVNTSASGDFAQTNNCPVSPATLAPAASCTISVTFKPTATGVRNGAITVSSELPGSPQTVTLTGTGVAPAVTLSGNSLTFAGQLITTTSSAQSVTFTNSGTAPLTISSIAVTGTNASDFAQTNTCPASSATLAVSANCSISVTFTPSATGNRTASVTITDNASGSPHTVSLTGTGTDFSLAAASGSNCPSGGNCSTSATISAGQSATYDLQVTPSNGFNGNVALTCTGAPGASTCAVSPASVPPAGSASYAFTVTVSNTANVMLVPKPHFRGIPGVRNSYGLLVLPMLLFAFWSLRSRASNSYARRVLVPAMAVLFFCLLYSTGCGGGGGGGGPQPPTNAVLKVTGTSSGVNRTVNLNLTVNH